MRFRRIVLVVSVCLGACLFTACTPDEVAQWIGVNQPRHENSWLVCIRTRESGGDYSINTGNGYYGAYQYLPGTWNSAAIATGHAGLADGRPDRHWPAEQDAVTLEYARQTGAQPWSGDIRYCGRP